MVDFICLREGRLRILFMRQSVQASTTILTNFSEKEPLRIVGSTPS